MNLKKTILGLALLSFMAVQGSCLAQQVPDSAIKGIVNQYKAKNYVGCVQASDKIIKVNPSNIFAHYYRGLAYIQLGKKDLAIESFEKVQTLNSNQTLVEYAQKGAACLNSPEECKKGEAQQDELDVFIKSNKFYDKSVQSEVNQKKLERIKNNINEQLGPQKSEMPTNEEIAAAVKTLAKIGFNPMAGNQMGGMYQNPEMMQANMLMGGNGANNNMNMLPMLMMAQQNGQKIAPEMIQSMMMSQMTPDFGSNYNNNY